jgi:hypothetical protein
VCAATMRIGTAHHPDCRGTRVVQMAAVLIIDPTFEADLLPQQYGFRPGLDAKMALGQVIWHVTQHGRPVCHFAPSSRAMCILIAWGMLIAVAGAAGAQSETPGGIHLRPV